MKKLLWKIYYLFVKTPTKSEQVKKFCRINGKPYVNLKLSKREDDL